NFCAVPQQAPADAQDHRPVALHQDCQGRFLVLGTETVQQLTVGEITGRLRVAQAAQVAEDMGQAYGGHRRGAREEGVSSIVPAGADLRETISSVANFFSVRTSRGDATWAKQHDSGAVPRVGPRNVLHPP